MMLLKVLPLKKLFKLGKIDFLRKYFASKMLDFTGIKSYKTMLDIVIRHLADTLKEETRVVWVPFIFPNEILTAFDIEPYTPESTTMTFLDFFGADATFDAAASAALSDDICSIQRSLYGCSILDLFPKPDFHLRGSFCSCDSQRIAVDAMDSVRDIPSFYIDTPITDRPHAKKYLKEELKALIDFCEDLFDEKFDWNRFDREVTVYREAWKILDEIMDIHAGNYFPFIQNALNSAHTLHFTCIGGPESVLRFTKELYEEVSTKISKAKEEGETRPEDEIRVLWQGLLPKPKHASIMDECRIRHVYDEICMLIGRLPEINDPLNAVIEKYLHGGCLYDIEKRIGLNLNLVKKYDIDGTIFSCQWGCRQGNAVAQPMKEALMAEGIPVLVLDCDMADSRNFFEEQTRTRFAAFAEMLRK